MANTKQRGLARLINAARFSWQGLRAAYKHEEAFRQEVWVFMLAVPLAFLLAENGLARALLIGSVLMVMLVELLNSALEAVVDRIGSEHHTLSGRAKDIGSAAVLLAIINAVLVWGLVLIDR